MEGASKGTSLAQSSHYSGEMDYFHRNPAHGKLVDNPDDWQHSSFGQIELGTNEAPFLCDSWDCLG
jgi:hypothetical protein